MILLVINAAGAVRNTEERKNSRKIQRENKRQNSKIRQKIENVKNNIGKNITMVFKILLKSRLLIGRSFHVLINWN